MSLFEIDDFTVCETVGDGVLEVTQFIDGAGESSIYLDPTQRRALLSHLLEQEGLPGVEEIADTIERRDQLRGRVTELEESLEQFQLQTVLEAKWKAERTVKKLRAELASARQARLSELLEAEARERVEVYDLAPPLYQTDWVKVKAGEPERSHLRRFKLGYAEARLRTLDGRQSLDYHIQSVTTAEEIMNIILCLATALAEKRKREQADG